ncbi:phage baseplate assembly protein V, partial [Xanthomonas citri]
MGNASSALSNAIRLGTVAEVNLANARCRLQVGEMLTDYLPWVVTLAGTTIIWSAPAIGEQVVVFDTPRVPQTLKTLVARSAVQTLQG